MFVISDKDDVEYEDDPAIIQAKANLAAAEHIQQEKAEQRRLEKEQQKAQAEVECLTKEIEEAEKKQRELEEVEAERLMWEKERLEEENRVEQWRPAALRGSERGAEQRQVALVVLLHEAGLSQAPPQKPERTVKGADQKPGIVIPGKNCAHGSHYVDGTRTDTCGVVSCVDNSRSHVGGLRSRRRRGSEGRRTRVRVRGLARG